jgi:hypothetical protein
MACPTNTAALLFVCYHEAKGGELAEAQGHGWNTEVGGELMGTQRALYVYSNGQGHYTIARQAQGAFLFQVAGPFTLKEALWWARDQGVIAFFPTQIEELRGS